MKRILILFIGLILGCNLTNAKSVSCWEEYASYATAHDSSFMATALGSDVTIVSTGIEYVGTAFISQIYSGAAFAAGSLYKTPTHPGSYNYTHHLGMYNTSSGRDNSSVHSTAQIYGTGKIYHYCIVDEGSSGGGGGGATGSVNFIIKATS